MVGVFFLPNCLGLFISGFSGQNAFPFFFLKQEFLCYRIDCESVHDVKCGFRKFKLLLILLDDEVEYVAV